MFNCADNYKLYKVLHGFMVRDDVDGFLQLLTRSFPKLTQEKDDLRMLFYITKDASPRLFEKSLGFFEAHRDEMPDCATRLEVLIYALNRFVLTKTIDVSRIDQVRDRLQSNPAFAVSKEGFSDAMLGT